MLDYLNNGYGNTLDVDTLCQPCDYDSEHYTTRPLFFEPLLKEPPTKMIDKAFDYYIDWIWEMQRHANETGHICDAYVHYFGIYLEVLPNIWSRLIRAVRILRGLENQ